MKPKTRPHSYYMEARVLSGVIANDEREFKHALKNARDAREWLANAIGDLRQSRKERRELSASWCERCDGTGEVEVEGTNRTETCAECEGVTW